MQVWLKMFAVIIHVCALLDIQLVVVMNDFYTNYKLTLVTVYA